MSWLKRMALFPLVIVVQVLIWTLFACALLGALFKWVRYGRVT